MGAPKTTIELYADEEYLGSISIIGTAPVDYERIAKHVFHDFEEITLMKCFKPNNEFDCAFSALLPFGSPVPLRYRPETPVRMNAEELDFMLHRLRLSKKPLIQPLRSVESEHVFSGTPELVSEFDLAYHEALFKYLTGWSPILAGDATPQISADYGFRDLFDEQELQKQGKTFVYKWAKEAGE